MITADEVRELLSYDQSEGIFRWENPPARSSVSRGDVAGTLLQSGYVHIKISKQPYLAHRLVWLVETGRWPSGIIDHINGNPSDNRFSNLRDTTQSENCLNRRCHRSGQLRGVTRRKNGKWFAQIREAGTMRALGTFDDEWTAHLAFLDAKKRRVA